MTFLDARWSRSIKKLKTRNTARHSQYDKVIFNWCPFKPLISKGSCINDVTRISQIFDKSSSLCHLHFVLKTTKFCYHFSSPSQVMSFMDGPAISSVDNKNSSRLGSFTLWIGDVSVLKLREGTSSFQWNLLKNKPISPILS